MYNASKGASVPMTTIIAPNGDSLGSTFIDADEYAIQMRRKGWIATVLGDKVYAKPGKLLAAHMRQAVEQAGI